MPSQYVVVVQALELEYVAADCIEEAKRLALEEATNHVNENLKVASWIKIG